MNNNDLLDKLSPEEARELITQARNLKRSLKSLSKNQLIQLVIEQVNIAVEQQNINKVLIEKLNIKPQEQSNV